MKIGVIGLGRMGGNIVRRLMQAGHSCVVYDANPTAGAALTKEGAVAADSIAALVEALDSPAEIPTPKRFIPAQPPPVRAALDPEAFTYVQRELQGCYPLTAQHSVIVINHDAGSMLPIRSWPRERRPR